MEPRQGWPFPAEARTKDVDRHVAWEGFANARDLGGLPARYGRVTRFGAYIRSGDLRFVTEAGWRAARDAGVRTVVDLRNEDEIRQGTGHQLTRLAGSAQFSVAAPAAAPPPCMALAEVALDDIDDTAFWQFLNRERLNGTPLYFRPFLDRKPGRCAAAVTALARAAPEGVIFHCGAGRDRTGLVALLVLALAGVEPESIASDYEMSAEPLSELHARMGQPDQRPAIEEALAQRGTTARDAIVAILSEFDAETYLLAAGVSPDSIATVRCRLLG